MAGFRDRRGQQPHGSRQQGQGPYDPRYGPPAGPPPAGQWRGPEPQGGPEYYDGGRPRPYYPDNPGHTHPYGVGESPDAYAPPPVPVGPRLPWREVLTGIVFHPNRTFWAMRDHSMWATALIVTVIYGVLAIFGFEEARDDVLDSTLSTSIPYALATGIFVTLGFLLLGVVTHTLARQLGGNGNLAPTVGLSMLIVTITDTPRLVAAMIKGGENTVVQGLGWLTLAAAGVLLTSMVSKSHEIPWPKALGASGIQLLALLFLIKLGTF
ncbi:Yip1 family protein [Streptomyces smaragdinus]|uniref:Yip1 family protein n=1 Tax=Streptomyces smaragdinus TaxID=2585196 RepID=UPI002B20ED52|nr:Yip1 family protein [Streptomyces smaragdinus]